MQFTANIHSLDIIIIVGYMLAVLLFGAWIGRKQSTPADYFLGDRSLPWGALLLSIVATETSTVTFLSIPGIAAALGGNFTFLQITFGYIVGRMLVIAVLLPLYFKGQAFTAYEVLEDRFGKLSRKIASTLFLITRNVSDALRLYLTALVLQIVVGLDFATSVITIGVITIAYTFIGGAKSVIWNDCIQFVIYMVGGIAALVILVQNIPGGLQELIGYAQANNKLQLFDFDFSWTKPTMTFWAGLIGGTFLTAATHGTDQLMVQRYLSSKSQRGAGYALGLSGFFVLAQFALFLFIGVGLAKLYQSGAALSGASGDTYFTQFIVTFMPVGLVGVTLAAIFAAAMSTLSSSLSSSAAALINDLYLPVKKQALSLRQQLNAGRVATIVFGFVQIGIALLFNLVGSDDSTVANVLKVAGFAAGPVLGLYLLAVFVVRVRQKSALIGFCCGVLILSWVALTTAVYWPWYALIGSITTLIFGYLASVILVHDGQSETAES